MSFLFLDINIKLSPSIFHCLITFDSSPVSNIFLFNKHTPVIQLELGTSIFLIN